MSDAEELERLRAVIAQGKSDEHQLRRILGASDIESAIAAADRLVAWLREMRAREVLIAQGLIQNRAALTEALAQCDWAIKVLP